MSYYKEKSILITGGLGFIGSHLGRKLAELGARVTLVDSLVPEYGGNQFNVSDFAHRVKVNVCDVRDPYAMRHLIRGQDLLFNLAGQTSHIDSMNHPVADLEINAAAQLSILESCRQVNPAIKIVFASTRQLYGIPDYLPVDEYHPIRPVDVNGINKWAGEQYHLLYNKVYGIRSCVLRLTNTYGPGMRIKDARQTFLGIWIRIIQEGMSFKVFGDGNQRRDFNYVDDCVEALLRAGESDVANGKVYNLAGHEVVSLKALAETLAELSPGSKFELIPFPEERKNIDIGDYFGDCSLITKELGWEPRVTLKDGLLRTLNFYRANSAHYLD